LQAEIELSRIANEETKLQIEHGAHQSHIKAILNRPFHHEDIRLDNQHWPKLTWSLEELTAIAFQKRPELQELSAMSRGKEVHVAIAKQTRLPDFTLGFTYKQMLAGEEDAWTGSIMVNLPVFYGSKNRHAIAEKTATLNAIEAERQALANHTRHEIEQAYHTIQKSEKIRSNYQNALLPQAKATLDLAQVAYRNLSAVNFQNVAQAALTQKEIKMSYAETETLFGMAWTDLERFTGTRLSERKEKS
jgi:outer membrane protein TolC